MTSPHKLQSRDACLQLFVEQTNTNSPVYLRQILAPFVPLTREEHNTNGPILSDHNIQRLRYTAFRGQRKNGSITKKDCKRCDRAQNINKKGQHSQNVNKQKTNSKEIILNDDQPMRKYRDQADCTNSRKISQIHRHTLFSPSFLWLFLAVGPGLKD